MRNFQAPYIVSATVNLRIATLHHLSLLFWMIHFSSSFHGLGSWIMCIHFKTLAHISFIYQNQTIGDQYSPPWCRKCIYYQSPYQFVASFFWQAIHKVITALGLLALLRINLFYGTLGSIFLRLVYIVFKWNFLLLHIWV